MWPKTGDGRKHPKALYNRTIKKGLMDVPQETFTVLCKKEVVACMEYLADKEMRDKAGINGYQSVVYVAQLD